MRQFTLREHLESRLIEVGEIPEFVVRQASHHVILTVLIYGSLLEHAERIEDTKPDVAPYFLVALGERLVEFNQRPHGRIWCGSLVGNRDRDESEPFGGNFRLDEYAHVRVVSLPMQVKSTFVAIITRLQIYSLSL